MVARRMENESFSNADVRFAWRPTGASGVGVSNIAASLESPILHALNRSIEHAGNVVQHEGIRVNCPTQILVEESDYDRAYALFYTEREDES
jgi:hypothetical protein